MTRPESAVPLRERVLSIEGIVAPLILDTLDHVRTIPSDARSRWLFVSLAYADIPRGSTYDHWWAPEPGSIPTVAAASVDYITQQYGRAFDAVPHGWRTIVRFRFVNDVPERVDELPVLHDWSYRTALLLGSEGAWLSQ